MSRRRAISGLLHNFLGTFVSRNSDHDGYWLLGFLVNNPPSLELNLLAIHTTAQDPTIAAASRIATLAFRDQLQKAGLPESLIDQASLTLTTDPETIRGQVNSHLCTGHRLRVVANATSDRGKTYSSECTLFVTPHNPSREWRSTRARTVEWKRPRAPDTLVPPTHTPRPPNIRRHPLTILSAASLTLALAIAIQHLM